MTKLEAFHRGETTRYGHASGHDNREALQIKRSYSFSK